MSNPETTLSKEELTDPNTTASDLLYNVEPPPVPAPGRIEAATPARPLESLASWLPFQFVAGSQPGTVMEGGVSIGHATPYYTMPETTPLTEAQDAVSRDFAAADAARRARLMGPGLSGILDPKTGKPKEIERVGAGGAAQYIPTRSDYTPEETDRLVQLLNLGSTPELPTVETPAVATAGTPTATSGVADAVAAAVAEANTLADDSDGSNLVPRGKVVTPIPSTQETTMPDEDDALTKILEKLTESQQPTGREWIPSAISGATGLLGAYLGSRAQGDAFKREDLRYRQQQDLLERARRRQEAAENYEAQLSHARELGLDAPRKRMSAAAQQRYAEGLGLKLDPELFKTPDLDPTFTGGAGGYLPPSNQDYINSELNTARRGGGGIKGTLGTILKYGLPALGAASGLGALGVPGMGWASKLAGGLGGLLGIGGGQKPIPSTPIDPNYGMYATQIPRALPRRLPRRPVARRPHRPEGTWI
jgi:hypothetical protein